MKKKINIVSGCIACGLCTSSKYIEEKVDGTVIPKGGLVLRPEDEAEFQKIIDECPAKVIELSVVSSKTREQIIAQMENEAESFALSVPSQESICAEEKHMQINAPYGVPGDSVYKYSSYNKARDAARQAIDQAFYSQRKIVVQNVINNYRIDKLSIYYDYKETKDNFYYSANQEAQKVLEQWVQEINLYNFDINIPTELLMIQTRPKLKEDIDLKLIESNLLEYAPSILSELSGDLYSLSSYVDYCNIDSSEIYVGEGLFGRSKYATKYCFSNTEEAFREMENDLKTACKYAFTEKIVEPAYRHVKNIVKHYSQELQKELKSKVNELKEII